MKGILQREPSKRLTIKQILSHAWFASPKRIPCSPLAFSFSDNVTDESPPPHQSTHASMSSDASDSTYTTFHSANSEFSQSAPTTPDEAVPTDDDLTLLHHNLSQSTIKTLGAEADNPIRLSTLPKSSLGTNHTTAEEEPVFILSSAPSAYNTSKAPPTHPTRTPARTKRRSVSSTLSTPSSPASPTHPNSQPPQDFVSTLNTPAPIVFSTPLERELLNNLSALGFDTGQMVHSVLTDACDSSGALWWMMRKKAERRALEEATRKVETKMDMIIQPPASLVHSESSESGLDGVGADHHSVPAQAGLSIAPDVGIVPPTPTIPETNTSMTPPQVTSPVLLSPTPSQAELQQRSNLSSPSSHNGKSRGTKPRSASVSIMQRATTALEAAGLVRKKSEEKVRKEEHDKEREREKERDIHKAREREEKEQRATSGEDSRSSGASHHKLTKSPPSKPKDSVPTTPDIEPSSLTGLPSVTSPWVIHPYGSSSSYVAPTPANSPGEGSSALPTSTSISSTGAKQQGRTRASILHTFRMWFHEDRKGKRKAPPVTHPLTHPHHHVAHPIATPTSAGSVRGGRTKRRSGSGSAPVRRGHQKRMSASSRRSSSVNSRRSSITSVQKIAMEYQHPDDPFNSRRRSFGARTPTSERGDFPSRPSSIRSVKVTTPGAPPLRRQSHSPSESSAGSGRRSIRRTDSPLQRYHRRGGSGSSTRVVRQIKTVHSHVRSDSVASSHQSAPPSRPGSFHEGSEAEAPARNGSPFRPSSRQSDDTPRRAPYSTTVLVAHKKQTPFRQPSLSRSSWKKAWGVEPPGWKSRSTEAPFEVLFTDDPRTSVRDVFSGRPSLNLGDEDEWIDEDDDVPFAGGLGQVPISNSHPPSTTPLESYHKPEHIVLSPPPRSSSRSSAPSKRTGNRHNGRKASHSPVACTSPLPQTLEHSQPESRGTRRQLPARAEPAFRQPIQEEDEDEEEE